MTRVFMIGDIHGCCKTIKKLLLEKINIRKTDIIYCLGDYIDRGPDSKGVIDFILHLRNGGYQIHTLRGNHEQMLLQSEIDDDAKNLWVKYGGDSTLASFNVNSISELRPEYLNFFDETAYFVQTTDFILAHAGLNFKAANPLLDFEAMLWIRDFSVDENFMNRKILIHGHTPMTREHILSQPVAGAVNIDGGCVYKERPGYGSLFALDFYERKFIEVKNID